MTMRAATRVHLTRLLPAPASLPRKAHKVRLAGF